MPWEPSDRDDLIGVIAAGIEKYHANQRSLLDKIKDRLTVSDLKKLSVPWLITVALAILLTYVATKRGYDPFPSLMRVEEVRPVGNEVDPPAKVEPYRSESKTGKKGE